MKRGLLILALGVVGAVLVLSVVASLMFPKADPPEGTATAEASA